MNITAMQQLGPVSQTFAGFLHRWRSSTFRRIERIAEAACLPSRTCRRHLKRLDEWGFVTTERTWRRTPTRQLTDKEKRLPKKFAPLPRWAATVLETFSERAVFSLVANRYHLAVRIAESERDEFCTDVADAVSHYGRLSYSLYKLSADSGLSRRIVIDAKQALIQRGLMSANGYRGQTADLALRANFRVPLDLIDNISHPPGH